VKIHPKLVISIRSTQESLSSNLMPQWLPSSPEHTRQCTSPSTPNTESEVVCHTFLRWRIEFTIVNGFCQSHNYHDWH
jgi:hypothetical protein